MNLVDDNTLFYRCTIVRRINDWLSPNALADRGKVGPTVTSHASASDSLTGRGCPQPRLCTMYRLGRGHGRTVANFSLGKTFFAHIFAKNGSIYVKGRMKWSPVQSTHIVEYFSPAEMLRFACVCLSSSVCTECIVAKRCILEQKLLLTAYRKSYMRNQFVPRSMTLTFV